MQDPPRVSTPCSYPTPSASPGAMPPSSDTEWSTNSDWSLGSSAPSSRAPSPSQVAARSTPQVPRDFELILQYLAAAVAQGLVPPSSMFLPPAPLAEAPAPIPASPEPPKHKRIPRPPNAFMLYRSWLIKSGKIPKDIEQRQQNISRVAGECWNMLKEEEQAVWHAQAKRVMEEHFLKYPGYKFSPARRARRKGGQTRSPEEDGAYIRGLRERCVQIYGEARPPPRPRKAKSRRGVGSEPPLARLLPGPLRPSPSTSPVSFRVPSAPPSLAASSAAQMMHSVAPNFLETLRMAPLPDNFYAQCIAAGNTSHVAIRDEDSTPRASTFGDIALPTQPKFDFSRVAPSAVGSSAPESDLGLIPSFVASPSQQGEVPRATTPVGSQWDTFLTFPNPLASNGASLEGHAGSLYAFPDYSGAMDAFAASLSGYPQSE